MAAFRHIGDGTAAKVLIQEARDLLQPCDPQAVFEPSAEPQERARDLQLDEQQGEGECQEIARGEEALRDETQGVCEIQGAAQNEGLENDTPRGEHQASGEHGKREYPIPLQEAQQLAARSARRLGERGGQLGTERGWGIRVRCVGWCRGIGSGVLGARGCRSRVVAQAAPHPDEHRAFEVDFLSDG